MLSKSSDSLPYIILTSLLFLLIWGFTHQINQAPLVALTVDTRLQYGWTAVSNSTQQFTLNIPVEWQQGEAFVDAYGGMNTAVTQTNQLFLDNDPDMALELVAYSDENLQNQPIFGLAVYNSSKLNQIDINDLISFIDQNEEHFKHSELVERGWHTPQAHFYTNPTTPPNAHTCEVRFAPTSKGAFIVTLCSRQVEYSRSQELFSTVLQSFQELK